MELKPIYQVRTKGGAFAIFHDMQRARAYQMRADPLDYTRAAKVPAAYQALAKRAGLVAAVPYSGPGAALLDDLRPGGGIDVFVPMFEIEAAVLAFGNVYLKKVTDGEAVVRLDWLVPQAVDVKTDTEGRIVSYRYGESASSNGATPDEYRPDEIIHIRDWNSEGPVQGMSRLEVCLGALNIEHLSVNAQVAFWRRGARPLGLLHTDQPMTDPEMEKVETWWRKLFEGATKAFRVGIVGGGLKWQSISFRPEELAFPEQREQDRLDVAAAFEMAPELLGARPANYATKRESRMEFIEEVVIPRLRWYTRIFQQEGILIDFDEDDIPGYNRLRESAQNTWRRD